MLALMIDNQQAGRAKKGNKTLNKTSMEENTKHSCS